MNETQIRCFLTASKSLSFTNAASQLFISQPAFSRNIANLEEELGFQLFIRDSKTKRIRLSPAGTVMCKGLLEISREFEDLVHEAEKADRGETGTLSIAFMEGEFVPDVLNNTFDFFQNQYPDVELTMEQRSFKGLIDGLYDTSLDFIYILKIEVENRQGIIFDETLSPATRLAVKKGHPLAGRKNLSTSDFRNETFIILPDHESGRLNKLLHNTCKKAGFEPKTITAPDLKTQLLWVETGKGIAGISELSYINHSPSMDTVEVTDMVPQEFVVAWIKDNYNPVISLFNSCFHIIRNRHRES